MRVLVTGVKGQLGYDVAKRLKELDMFDFKGVDLEDFDLTNHEQTIEYIRNYAPDAIVHCAAYTAVDRAETEQDICYAVNVNGTQYIAEACKEIDAKMVYISTDYVFDGDGDDELEVDSPKKPISVYGKTKSLGEDKVTELLSKYFIIRTSWVFGINGNNFVKTMSRLGSERSEISVVADQFGSPTYTPDLARLIVDMIQTEKYGTYHGTNEGFCSWYDFAKAIMEKNNLACKVLPITTEQYPTPAKRPHNSRLSKVSLDKAGFKRLPNWEDALERYVAGMMDK